MAKPKDISKELKAFDDEYRLQGKLLAGMDEAGRGPLAGPVVCACVEFHSDCLIPYVNDSKKLSPKRREELFDIIEKEAICLSYGIVENQEIDEINILNATKKAMKEAVNKLQERPDILLIDAVELPDMDIVQHSITKGDAKSFSIAAASIMAKTLRDRIMMEYDAIFPQYGFAAHKGYGTKAHYEALRAYGPCTIHRMSFLKNMH